MRRALAILALPAVVAACHGGLFEEKYVMGEERIVRDFGGKVRVYGTVLLPAGRGGVLSIWSDEEGVWSLPLSRSGSPMRDPARVSRLGAARIAGVSLEEGCAPSGARFVLVAAPRVDVTKGSAGLEVMLLGPEGRRSRTVVMDGKVGPYTTQVSVAGGCDGVLVGWHQGAIGDFSARVAFIDVDEGAVRWERRLSDEGTNGFCPGLLAGEGGFMAAWGEVRPTFRSVKDKPVPDSLVMASLDLDGGFTAGPRYLLPTFRPSVAPALQWSEDRIALAYKDYPVEAFREGLYLAFVDTEGGVEGEPRRVGRGDGPDQPVLMSMSGGRLLTAVVRSLAFELLVGVNHLDSRGEKLSGELQIYAHQVQFRHLSAVIAGRDILLHHVEQTNDGTRLLVTELHPSRR